jgi:cysteine-rich repeat protein
VCGDGVVGADAGEECDDGATECYSLGNSNGTECGTRAGAAACAADLGQCGPPGQGDCFPECAGCAAGACNSNAIRDACTIDCRLPHCGDGKADTGELCDDGLDSGDPSARDAADEGDDCPNGPASLADGIACLVSPTCGDAWPHLAASECDNGTEAGTLCTPACGTPVESCDSGAGTALVCLLDAPGSTADCLAIGGTPGPLADDCLIERTSTCAKDPTLPCAADSDCDGGASGPCGNNDTAPDACRGDCAAAGCGDDVVDTGEECDDGAAACTAGSPNAGAVCDRDDDCDDNPPCLGEEADCRETCVDAGGDTGELDGGEPCERPGQVGVIERRCAGGIDAGLSCTADGDCASNRCLGVCNSALADACHACGNPRCGDGIVDAGEECDEGPGNGTGGPCSTGCRHDICGDGRTCGEIGCAGGPRGGPEECDDGNAEDGDACKTDCSLNLCGDGVTKTTQPLQLCDDGNTLDWDGCSAACCPEFSGVTDPFPEKLATSRCNQERLAALVEQVPERLRCAVVAKRQMRRHSVKVLQRLERAEARCAAGASAQCCFYLRAAGLSAARVGRSATRTAETGCIEAAVVDPIGDVAATVAQVAVEARDQICAPPEG